MSCPCCHSAESRLRGCVGDRLFRVTAKKFQLRECARCHVVFLFPVPTAAELAGYYPSHYWWQAAPRKGGAARWHELLEIYRRVTVREQVRRIRRLAARFPRQAPRLLDVGCGDGLFLDACQTVRAIRVGLDPSSTALRAAQRRGGIRVIQGSLEALPFSNGSLSVITAIHVLEHVPSPRLCLQELYRVLEPGGWLTVQVPNAASLQRRLLGLRWAGFDVPRHLLTYNPQNLRAALESSGFHVQRLSHFSWRDNPAVMVMSLFPRLYPPARRLSVGHRKPAPSLWNALLDCVYLLLVLAATPLALGESLLRRGGTIVVEAQRGDADATEDSRSGTEQCLLKQRESAKATQSEVDSRTVGDGKSRVQTSFVVINWNHRPLLEKCLRSLEQQISKDFELILVDNGSTDGSLNCLDQFSLPAVKIIRNPENYGFCRAANQGIRAASGRFIALVNNDAILDPHWLEEIQLGFSGDARVGMCASKILSARETHRIDKVGHLMYPDGQSYGRGHREVDRGQYDRVEEVLCPDGAVAIYRAEVFQDAGLLDEDFFAYGDDAELGLRARLRGWKCLYIPTARAYHYHSATLGAYDPQKIFLIERNRIWLAVKLFPGRQLLQLPFYSATRYLFSLWALVTGAGDVGRMARQGSVGGILWAVVRAQAAAALGLPLMWAKRREIQRGQQIPGNEFVRLLKQHSISARQLLLHG